jgi:hypothetical protein
VAGPSWARPFGDDSMKSTKNMYGVDSMKRATFQKILFVLFILFINLGLTLPINAAETAESIKASYQRFLDNIDVKFFDEKVPYLLKTEWDQSGIYAMHTPTKVRVGCWATAVAQILYYHKLLPQGKVSYQCTEGYKIIENLNSYKFNWDLFVNKINDNTIKESIDQVAKYSYYTAVVMQKDFGIGGHVLKGNNFKNLLESHFDCKVNEYQFLEGSFLKERNKIVKIIKEELAAARPVAFFFGNQYDWGHAVVIDGYLEKDNHFLVHINQGLGGSGNGIYKLFDPIIPSYGDMYWRVIMTIKPKK